MTAPASFDLTGRVALVTGGNRGIGRGIALGFAQAGATVAIFGRNAAKNAEVLAALQSAGARALALAVDVTDRAALEPAYRRVEAELGPVDILVNNAGLANLRGGILLETAEAWDAVIETQLNAVEAIIHSMTPAERAKRVLNVNLDSLAGAEGITALTSGVPGMVEFLHTALAPAGMSVGISAPFMGNSDHANYLRHGIPALRLCTGFDRPQSNMRFLLTPADTPNKVHPHQLKLAASIAALLVLAGCASPAAPVPRLDEASAQRITA